MCVSVSITEYQPDLSILDQTVIFANVSHGPYFILSLWLALGVVNSVMKNNSSCHLRIKFRSLYFV